MPEDSQELEQFFNNNPFAKLLLMQSTSAGCGYGVVRPVIQNIDAVLQNLQKKYESAIEERNQRYINGEMSRDVYWEEKHTSEDEYRKKTKQMNDLFNLLRDSSKISTGVFNLASRLRALQESEFDEIQDLLQVLFNGALNDIKVDLSKPAIVGFDVLTEKAWHSLYPAAGYADGGYYSLGSLAQVQRATEVIDVDDINETKEHEYKHFLHNNVYLPAVEDSVKSQENVERVEIWVNVRDEFCAFLEANHNLVPSLSSYISENNASKMSEKGLFDELSVIEDLYNRMCFYLNIGVSPNEVADFVKTSDSPQKAMDRLEKNIIINFSEVDFAGAAKGMISFRALPDLLKGDEVLNRFLSKVAYEDLYDFFFNVDASLDKRIGELRFFRDLCLESGMVEDSLLQDIQRIESHIRISMLCEDLQRVLDGEEMLYQDETQDASLLVKNLSQRWKMYRMQSDYSVREATDGDRQHFIRAYIKPLSRLGAAEGFLFSDNEDDIDCGLSAVHRLHEMSVNRGLSEVDIISEYTSHPLLVGQKNSLVMAVSALETLQAEDLTGKSAQEVAQRKVYHIANAMITDFRIAIKTVAEEQMNELVNRYLDFYQELNSHDRAVAQVKSEIVL